MRSIVEVGPCQQADLPQLFGLALSAFGGRPGWDDRSVVSTLLADVIFVARERGRPVGYVALGREADGLVIEQILVAQGHEQQGIGRRLLGAAETFAGRNGAPYLGIAVEPDNWTARSFYERWGFQPVASERFELRLPRP